MSDLAAPDDKGGPGPPGLVYVHIANDIEADIRSGALPPGARLMSERALAEKYGRS
jgi:DNA-binding GntR family transcriptional regulator